MAQTQNIRRFRTNPIEVAVFSIITLVFVNSVYNLLYDHGGFHPVALVPMASKPLSEGRTIASIPKSPLLSLSLNCSEGIQKDTTSNKVRLMGQLCGFNLNGASSELVQANIVNQSNQFHATLFTDMSEGKFSTDYIPLNPGDNTIHVEFAYHDGKNFAQDLTLKRLE